MNLSARSEKAKAGFRIAIAFGVGAFLILYATLGFSSWELGKQRQALESEAAFLSRSVRARTMDNYQEKLQTAQERLERASGLFPEQLKASQALETILAVASRSGAGLLGFQEKALIREVVGTHVYYSWPFTLRAQGSQEHLLGLIARLEQGEGGPLVLQKVSLTRNRDEYIASLDLAFYTRSRTETVPAKTEAPAKGRQSRGQP